MPSSLVQLVQLNPAHPPEFAHALAEVSVLDDTADDSVLRSIYAKLMGKGGMDMASFEFSIQKASRPASGIRVSGFDTFDEVRRPQGLRV